MAVEVRGEAFNPWQALEHYQQTVLKRFGQYGATAVFVGSMRDFNEGSQVRSMTLEHYPGMTEKHLEAISVEARERWDILDSLIIHRHGAMHPGDPIVLVAVWTAHWRRRMPARFAALPWLRTKQSWVASCGP